MIRKQPDGERHRLADELAGLKAEIKAIGELFRTRYHRRERAH